jgi:energy-coupling factor transport system ATP-binding protein
LGYILAGLYPENGGFLTEGTVRWGDVDIGTLTPDKRVAWVSMMFQNPDLQFCMNNAENEMRFCLENIGTPESEWDEIVRATASDMGITPLLHRNFNILSGGEKQKCALACLMILQSKCIILDEAFANIDTQSAVEIIRLIKKPGVTVLAIDHNLALWEGVYDHVISLDGSQAKTIDFQAKLNPVGETVLATRGLSVRGIDYADMQFEKGSLTAILGKSGCGKTTLLKTIMKQNKYKGKIIFMGRDFRKIKNAHVFSKCGIVFQNPSNQFLSLTVYDEILYSVNQWYKNWLDKQKEDKVLELLALFDLERYKKYSPYLLSQGQQRRLAVLSMIAGEQDILLLDEPTYGQDYENIAKMMELLLAKTQHGLTVIFVTHNENLARHFAHKLIRLDEAHD